MKKLYGLYKQFQEQEVADGQPIVLPQAAESTTSFPEVKPTPQKDDPIKMKATVNIHAPNVKLP